jgi:hypothetical protein
MCMNCGCGRPNDDNGNSANITAADLQRAADANRQTLRQSAQHILESVERMHRAGREGSGLAEPAAASGGQGGGRGTPASES